MTEKKRQWKWKDGKYDADLLNAQGRTVARMSQVQARGIAAAMNTPEGREAFEKARQDYSKGKN